MNKMPDRKCGLVADMNLSAKCILPRQQRKALSPLKMLRIH
jgi:hypothetical protein